MRAAAVNTLACTLGSLPGPDARLRVYMSATEHKSSWAHCQSCGITMLPISRAETDILDFLKRCTRDSQQLACAPSPDGHHDAVVAQWPARRLEDAGEAKVGDLDAPMLLWPSVLTHHQHV